MKNIGSRQARHTAHVRYLPGYAEGGPWKICAFNTGNDTVPPGFKEYPYPQDKRLHPDPYFYIWEQGRVLDDYHILIIEEGGGVLETKTAGTRTLRAGDAFILFPGEWHRYRPNSQTGWRSWWIGLRGAQVLHLMNSFFSPEQPVIPLRDPERTLDLYREIAERLNSDPEHHQGCIAALASALIDEFQCSGKSRQTTARQGRVGKAKLTLLARSQEEVDLEKLAAELGMSYSSFRREFKAEAGIPPRQYLLTIRINRAKALLSETNRTAVDIAATVGFSSPGYFSCYFQQATGLTPLEYRKKMRK
ncbi:MAG: AraC family transcriptional regulator [Kiritimatiellales bacterium]|jgi:AraC-like DNA-binding protein